ncbi:hypothetical protein Q428_08445 [Fervidicella metallireducens AeB]|uniref:NADPH-dependent FMN reductase-like domain-containing protein n=1 Tax=Fervidicella metallireducens AeB TaxID=1403537 RepID=A0A017RUG2_9CLOT|nr:flavodoxin family protein [Fervidicella metallireducens]EYE88327.1 hypothetical protein Q428_08445 [Fervidicella metallireducens AeB]
MKALVLFGSPREKGNTWLLTNEFIKGLKEADIEVVFIDTTKMKVNPCNGCLACEKTGKCVISDDMNLIYKEIEDCKILILSSPVYFAGVSAQLKLVIDRCQALFSKNFKGNLPLSDKKRGYLIFTSGRSSEKMLQSMELCAKYFMLSCNSTLVESIYAMGLDRVKIDDEFLKSIYKKGIKAGRL